MTHADLMRHAGTVQSAISTTARTIAGLLTAVRSAQRVFDRTGGLHATGLFDTVSAPSSLAIDLPRAANVTLLGFVRGAAFNIYAHPQRVHLAEPDRPYAS